MTTWMRSHVTELSRHVCYRLKNSTWRPLVLKLHYILNTKSIENANTCSLYFCLSFIIFYVVRESVFNVKQKKRIWATISIRFHRNHPLGYCCYTHRHSCVRWCRTIQHSGSWILRCILSGICTRLVQGGSEELNFSSSTIIVPCPSIATRWLQRQDATFSMIPDETLVVHSFDMTQSTVFCWGKFAVIHFPFGEKFVPYWVDSNLNLSFSIQKSAKFERNKDIS